MMNISILKLTARSGVRISAFAIAYCLALLGSAEPDSIASSLQKVWPYAAAFVVIGLAHDLISRAWNKSWRFTSLKDIILAARSTTLVVLGLLLAVFVLDRGEELPRSALFFSWMLDIGIFCGLLVVRRAAHENTLADALTPFLVRRKGEGIPLLLIGTLDAADSFLRELNREAAPRYLVTGLVAPHAGDLRREVRGIHVTGSLEDIDRVLEAFSNPEGERAVLFLDGAPAPADLDAEVLAQLRKRGTSLLRLNRMTDLETQLGALSLRELDFNELLARPPVHLDHDRVRQLITGKRVLVTGAGGSIGSEIARQVAALSCSHLAVLDNSEFGLFKIEQEIETAFSTLSLSARICDVRDRDRITTVVAQESPEIVFHAAALKHVPLMEAHPSDSVLTNVIGSSNVVNASIAAGARNFVFISTDKAVAPPNVMGATKRLAERAVSQRRRPGGPRINVVRFGNVLGSAGSVVPTFLSQIARGGPVTLTHPDIERYFMTIPEAVQLVLHATAKSAIDDVEGVLVLDMGKPVKIVELAKRLIELHGKTPGVDVEIRVTGLRPGEKMTEALVDTTEVARHCEPGLLEVVDQNASVRLTDPELEQIEALARQHHDAKVRDLLFTLLAKLRAPSEGNVRRLTRD